MDSMTIGMNGQAVQPSFFKSVSWCHKQWKYFASPLEIKESNMQELLMRIVLFIPLTIITAVAYVHGFFVDIPIIVGSGISKQKQVDLSAYSIKRIRVDSFAFLKIEQAQDDHSFLVTDADDNVIDLLQYRIEENELVISTPDDQLIRPQVKARHLLIIPSKISFLKLEGSGEVELDEVDSNHFSCEIRGEGCVKINSGSTIHQKISLFDHGDYYAGNLTAKISDIAINTISKAVVNSVDELKVKIIGHGVCYYFGSPKVTKDVSSSGVVAKLSRV